jgi:hypothetical protein
MQLRGHASEIAMARLFEKHFLPETLENPNAATSPQLKPEDPDLQT